MEPAWPVIHCNMRCLGFRGPSPCVRGFLPLEAVNRLVELLGGRLPLVGSAVLSERGPLCAAVWEEFLSGCLPLLGSGWERGRGSELAPRSSELSLGRGSVEAFGSMGGQTIF